VTLPAGAHNARRVGGGDINEAWHVTLHDGREAFVKTRADASPREYAEEARGLAWLAAPGALRTPQVLEIGADYLVLEWIPPGRLSSAGMEELGRGLAATHAAGAPVFGNLAVDDLDLGIPALGNSARVNRELGGAASGIPRFGSLELPNDPCLTWSEFYAERRLLPLVGIARQRGALSSSGVRAVERVCERMGRLAGPPEPPARLHGDLWTGNVHADHQGRPWLIDPSVYGGHREVDLAMLRLFGAPSERVFDAYQELSPLADGWRERVELWQLLPLLVHAILFGGSYGDAAERVAQTYAR
jgi:fructosamine-3-kinase